MKVCSGTWYRYREAYTPYAGAIEMLLHINETCIGFMVRKGTKNTSNLFEKKEK